MRVEKINLNQAQPKTLAQTKNTYKTLTLGDSVTFKGNDEDKKAKKPSLIDRFLTLIGKKELSEEEKTSEEIKYFMGDIAAMGKGLDKNAAVYSSILNTYLKIGKSENFKNYIPCDMDEERKLVFGKIDEDSELPESITVVSMKGGMKVEDVYTIYGSKNLFSIQTTDGGKTKMNFTVCNRKILHYEELNEETGISKEFAPSKNGFHYFEGKKDFDGNITETINEADFSYDENERSTATLTDDNGEKHTYSYNKLNDLWEEEKNKK